MIAYYQFTQFDNVNPIPASADNQVNRGIPLIPYNNPESYSDPWHYDRRDVDSENLVMVQLVGPAGVSTNLIRGNLNIDVWADPYGLCPILPQYDGDDGDDDYDYDDDDDENGPIMAAPIEFDDNGTCVVWVGWDGSTGDDHPALLTLQAEAAPGGQPNQVAFKKSDVLIVGFAGHTQGVAPGGWNVRTNTGVHQIYEELKKDYPIRLLSEDHGSQSALPLHCGEAATEAVRIITNVFNRNGVRHLALYGYSHGGGTVYKAADLLDKNRPRDYSLEWTGYIDAIKVSDTDAEPRLPPGTRNHFNRWQSQGSGVHGKETDGLGDQENTDVELIKWKAPGLDHTNTNGRGISEDPLVRMELIASLKSKL